MEQSLTLLIAEIPLFSDLDYEETDTIQKMLDLRSIKGGSLIYAQGEHADSMCCVIEGELEVVKQLKEGGERLLTTLSKGDSVGEMALIDGLTRSANIRAKTNARILILKRDDFNKLIKLHPQISIKILKQIARRLSMNLRKTSEAASRAGK
ncbi:MAG: cyclic nucleotide-binding domain-containing protein [Gammaproteobacteria bacterium]|nr:MAG: cyclic nucleotide-binding domain-containing protein [Gammaproteobacteria bacterium]